MTVAFEWGTELPRLSGARLHLRGLVPGDAPAIHRIFGDAEVMRYWSSPPLVDRAAAVALVEETRTLFASRTLFQWGLAGRDDDSVIGTCTLLSVDHTHRRAEVGIALGRDAWGRGFASETLEVLIGFAFESLGLHRLEADIDPKNERSLRLFERQGFQREGYLRERWHHLGEYCDTVLLGLLDREWSKGSS